MSVGDLQAEFLIKEQPTEHIDILPKDILMFCLCMLRGPVRGKNSRDP